MNRQVVPRPTRSCSVAPPRHAARGRRSTRLLHGERQTGSLGAVLITAKIFRLPVDGQRRADGGKFSIPRTGGHDRHPSPGPVPSADVVGGRSRAARARRGWARRRDDYVIVM